MAIWKGLSVTRTMRVHRELTFSGIGGEEYDTEFDVVRDTPGRGNRLAASKGGRELPPSPPSLGEPGSAGLRVVWLGIQGRWA